MCPALGECSLNWTDLEHERRYRKTPENRQMLSVIIKASHTPFEQFHFLIPVLKQNKERDNIDKIEGQRHA